MATYGKNAVYKLGRRAVSIDSETALWIARMLIGEGWKNGKAAAILWTLMNRYMYSAHKWPSFLTMIRNFSQPINDSWLPGGKKFEEYKNYKTESAKQATSAAAVKRRKWIRTLNWSDIPIELQNIIAQFIVGQLPYPAKFGRKKFNNFASYPGLEKKWPGGVYYGKEYFLSDKKMPSENIQIVKNGRPSKIDPKSPGGFIFVAIPALLAAFYVLKN